MRVIQIVSGAAIAMAAVACTHNQTASSDSRIKPSSTSPARDSASEYGNQGTRMGSPTDSSRRDQAGTSSSGMAAQSDASLIGSPAWWRTHVTADGKPRS
jgi:hypothetical protein